MHLKICTHLIFLFLCLAGFCQTPELSPASQVSVITCGPGEELYASFGHSAFRVQDPAYGMDWSYNYGTFDFEAPNFYLNFARGKLLYSLSRNTFSDFLYIYEYEHRWVKEQLLHLDLQQRQELFNFLENNRKPENKDYKYDFLFDNCSTKIPEVIKKVLGDQLVFREGHLASGTTFRQLIRQNLRVNSWSAFGIDLALGSVIDRYATPEEYMFLPFYVMLQLNNSSLEGNRLVERERTILEAENHDSRPYFTTSPLFWLLLLFVFSTVITWIDLRHGTRCRWLDFFLFLLTGLAGVVLFFLWFLTDHSATADNFNIFWAFPPNLLAGYFLVRKRKPPAWISVYCAGLIALLLLTLLFWLFRVQQFSPLLPVLLGTLAIRYGFLWHQGSKLRVPATI